MQMIKKNDAKKVFLLKPVDVKETVDIIQLLNCSTAHKSVIVLNSNLRAYCIQKLNAICLFF